MCDCGALHQLKSHSANRLSAAVSSEGGGGAGQGQGHFRGGGEAVFGLAPGTGLEGEKRGGVLSLLRARCFLKDQGWKPSLLSFMSNLLFRAKIQLTIQHVSIKP